MNVDIESETTITGEISKCCEYISDKVLESSYSIEEEIHKSSYQTTMTIHTQSQDQGRRIIEALQKTNEEIVEVKQEIVEVKEENREIKKCVRKLLDLLNKFNCLKPDEELESNIGIMSVTPSGQVRESYMTADGNVHLVIEPQHKKQPYSGTFEQSVETTFPCSHEMDKKTMKVYCVDQVNQGRFRFVCPVKGCRVEWSYSVIRRRCNFKKNDMQNIEIKLSVNYLVREAGMKTCPGCKSFCVRDRTTDNKILCPHCTKDKKKYFFFCWACKRQWKKQSPSLCGNIGCSGDDSTSSGFIEE